MEAVDSWEKALELLTAETRAQVVRDEPLCRHTTLRVGGPADYFINATDTNTLAEVVALAQRLNLPHFLLGEGSNVCTSDTGVRWLVVRKQRQR